MENNKQDIGQVVLNRMANEIGTLKARTIQVETYNEVLVNRVKELEGQLKPIEDVGLPEKESE